MAYPVKRAVLRLVKHTVNRVSVPLARSGHGPFVLVRHVGRRSGRTYATPLVVARVPDGFVITTRTSSPRSSTGAQYQPGRRDRQ